MDALRPHQKTAIKNLVLAGDWTATGWPATMEGAIRSGFLAAEVVLEQIGKSAVVCPSELHGGVLARWLMGPP